MYTSDIEVNSKKALKTAFLYLFIALFCVLFGAVYELYSHEVYSFYMIYAFVFPLIGGTLPFMILSLERTKKYPNAIARNLYHSGIATLTVGSVVRGVLEIYGTTNTMADYYWPVGILLAFFGLLIYVVAALTEHIKERSTEL